MRISECMTRDVQLCGPETSLRDAARMMADCDAGALPVGENDRIVGMITDRDMAIRGLARGLGADAPVRDAMTQDVRYCFEDEDADEVLQMMSQQKVRRMPVLNREKRLVGIISLGDLSRSNEPRRTGEALSHIAIPGGEHSQRLH
jgi:CBS domain-containing protein